MAINPISGGFVNGTEDDSPLSISGTSSGADGQTVTVSVGTGAGAVSTTATVATGGAWTATLSFLQVQSLTQGTVSVSASVNGVTTSTSFVYDATAPSVSINPISGGFVNGTEDNSDLSISGTATGADGQTVTVSVGGVSTTATVASGGWTATLSLAQVQGLAQGTVSVSANVSDVAGNAAPQASAEFVYDDNEKYIESAAELEDLVAGNYSFAADVDVLVTGTAFQGTTLSSSAINPLFANADVEVNGGGLLFDQASGADTLKSTVDGEFLETLTADLVASGVDRIALSDDQVSLLGAANKGGADFSFDNSIEVHVSGTSFLNPALAPGVSTLFPPDADVTVDIGDALDQILTLPAVSQGGAFDTLINKLDTTDVVDSLEFTYEQAVNLAASGVDFDVSTMDVVVQGTAFLNSDSTGSGSTLFTTVNPPVTVTFSKYIPPSPGPASAEGSSDPFAQAASFGIDSSSVDELLTGPDLVGQLSGAGAPNDEFSTAAVDPNLAAVDLLVDTIASSAYVDIVSASDLASALSDVGLGGGVVFDDSLAQLMSVLAAPSSSQMLPEGPTTAAAGALFEGVSGGLVLDAHDLAGLVDVPSVGDLPLDQVAGSAVDPVALLAQMASQGTPVGLLGGSEIVPADPFDPFNQNKT